MSERVRPGPAAPDLFHHLARRAGEAARTSTEELVVTTAALHQHRRRQTVRRGALAGVLAVVAATAVAVVLVRSDATSLQPVAPPTPTPTSQVVQPPVLEPLGVSLTLPAGWEVDAEDASSSQYVLRVDGADLATATVFVPGRELVSLLEVPGLVDLEQASTPSSVGLVGLNFYEVAEPMPAPLCIGAVGEACGVPDLRPGPRYVAAFLGDGDGGGVKWVVHGVHEQDVPAASSVPVLVQGFSDE